jgi:hypothetical protein
MHNNPKLKPVVQSISSALPVLNFPEYLTQKLTLNDFGT